MHTCWTLLAWFSTYLCACLKARVGSPRSIITLTAAFLPGCEWLPPRFRAPSNLAVWLAQRTDFQSSVELVCFRESSRSLLSISALALFRCVFAQSGTMLIEESYNCFPNTLTTLTLPLFSKFKITVSQLRATASVSTDLRYRATA